MVLRKHVALFSDEEKPTRQLSTLATDFLRRSF